MHVIRKEDGGVCLHEVGMPNKTTLLAVMAMLSLLFLLGALLAGFVPQNEGNFLRRAASRTVVKLTPKDMPKRIERLGNATYLWAMREKAVWRRYEEKEEKKNLSPISFQSNTIVLLLSPHLFPSMTQPTLMPLLAMDGFSEPVLVSLAPSRYDIIDQDGRPLRWLKKQSLEHGYIPLALRRNRLPTEEEKRQLVKAKTVILKKIAQDLPKWKPVQGKRLERAKDFQNLIAIYASRYNLDPTLLKAIIFSESNFNTNLVSPRSAVGLMQVLPSTASKDVHRYLYGKEGHISREDLHDPSINIRYGTTYLHILTQRYFSEVRDPLSREYCIVAAYNMGPQRVIRSFGANPHAAAEMINRMDAEAVFQHLTSRLPRQETRAYVSKVRSVKQQYSSGGK